MRGKGISTTAFRLPMRSDGDVLWRCCLLNMASSIEGIVKTLKEGTRGAGSCYPVHRAGAAQGPCDRITRFLFRETGCEGREWAMESFTQEALRARLAELLQLHFGAEACRS